MRIQTRKLFFVIITILVTTVTFSQTPNQTQTQESCDTVLIQNTFKHDIVGKQLHSVMTLVERSGYEEFKKSKMGNAAFSLLGISIGGNVGYEEFTKKRDQFFAKNQIFMTNESAESIVSTTLPDANIDKWIECKRLVFNRTQPNGIYIFVERITPESIHIQVKYMADPGNIGKIAYQTIMGGSVDGVEDGYLFPQNEEFQPGVTKARIIKRSIGKPVDFVLNINAWGVTQYFDAISSNDLLWKALNKADLQGVKDAITKYNADVNSQDVCEKTPLIKASGEQMGSIVEYLLTVPGIDLNKTTTEGHSAVYAASAICPNSDVVEKLLKAGCYPNITWWPKNPNDERFCNTTALDFAEFMARVEPKNSDRKKIVEVLKRYGAQTSRLII